MASSPEPRTRSLRVRLVIAAIATATLPLGLFAIVAAQRQADLVTEGALTRLEGQASAQVGRLTEIVRGDLEIADRIASDPDYRLAIAQGSIAEENHLRQEIASFADVRSIVRLDLMGRPVAGTPRSAVDTFTADRSAPGPGAAIRAALSQDDSPSGFVEVDITGFDGVPDPLLGRLVVEIDLIAVTAVGLDYTGLSETGETSIAQRNADGSASFLAPLRFRPGAVLAGAIPPERTDLPVIQAVNGVTARFVDSHDYRAEPVLAVTKVEPVSGWGVVVKMDRSEALHGVDEYRATMLGALAVGVALAVIAALIFGERLSRPIREIALATRRLGRGELDVRIGSARTDEVGELARSVDTMAARLQEAERVELQRRREIERVHGRLRSVFDAVAEAILDVDDGFVVVEANPAAELLFGRDVIGQPLSRLFVPSRRGSEAIDPLAMLLANAIDPLDDADGEAADRSAQDTPLLITRDDGLRHVQALAAWHGGAARGLSLVIRDVTHRLEQQRELRHQASHDALTGLLNRGEVVRLLEQDRAGSGCVGAVFFIDLDRFKIVNDAHGHAVGDEVLSAVAARLRAMTRETDMLARYGGDEFVLLCTACRTDDDATGLAERLSDSLRRPIVTSVGLIRLSASIGVVTPSGLHHSAGETLVRADLAMYRAKDLGRDRFATFTPELADRSAERNSVELALREAIEADELTLAYQPVVDLDAGAVTGFEALARWNLDGVPMSPAEFIPLAEETGLIVPLGRQLMRRAMHDTAGWQDRAPGCGVAINLSARELGEDDLVDAVRVMLAETGVAAELITLEITETAVMEQLDDAVQRLDALRGMGVRISLDDFGTGFSSLSHLRQLPVDTVKIDRSFVAELDQPDAPADVVAVVLGLGGSLGLYVIAEGIETDEQAVAYLASGGTYAQGYRFARPQPVDQAVDSIPAVLRVLQSLADARV